MNIHQLLIELNAHDISASLEGDDLLLNFDGEEIPGSLIDEIKSNKSDLITYLKKYGDQEEVTDIQPVSIQESYPMSYAQRRIWILSQHPEVSKAYVIPHEINLSQDLNLDAFTKAVNAVIDRHEILRTVFKEDENGDIRQWILSGTDVNFEIAFLDVSQHTNGTELADKYVEEDGFKEFDLENGPLLRASLIKLSANTYRFYYIMHHIISDGWSFEVLGNDVLKYYEAYKRDVEPNIAPLKIQYKDYASWQASQLKRDKVDIHKKYWLNIFKDNIPVIEIPSEKLRPQLKTNNGELVELYFPKETTNKLKGFTREHQGSMFITMFSIWNILLHRYTNQNEIVLGTVVAGRDHLYLEDQIGFYVNTLALKNSISPNETFTELYEKIKVNFLEAFSHQTYPFDLVVKDLAIPRDNSRSPLFDVMYTYQSATSTFEEDFVLENEIIDTLHFEGRRNAKFDIEINTIEIGDYLRFTINYNTDIYRREIIEQILKHFKALSNVIMDNPTQNIGDYIFLSEEERHKLLVEFNDTDKEINYEKDKTILDLYKSRVLEYPESISVCYQGITLNYRELDGLTSQLSNYLQVSFGVLPNDLVGLKLERSENMLVSVLGILKCGAAYVPLDTSYPEARLAYIKSDSGYKVCIDELFLETFEKEKDNFKRTVEGVSVTEKNIAYAIYTSGSTGNPKGVLNDHAGLYNRLLWMRDDLGINSEDVILQKTPYTFDVSVWELLMPCITGCKLVFAKPEGHKDPLYLQELIEEQAISIVHFVPSMLGIFLEGLDVSRCKSLKHVVCSGEALPAVLVEEFKEKLPWVRIHNLYGPTEAAIDVSSIELTEVDTNQTGVTIGKPVANTKLYIVDKHMSLQPIGVPGELLIEGVQVARGYLNRPELTAEKFIASPFHSGERVYRTGDLAKWLPNGEIAYLGRIDNQVKIRGNRIELGEIETRIFQSGYVSNSVVVVKGEGSLRKFLVAYVIPKEGYQQEILYAYLKDQLPDYMLPSMVIEMESFPITANGKLNRKALPEAAGDAVGLSSYVAPGNEMEESLATIWKEVLEIDKVGVRDNFFRIGGDSIMAIRLVGKINKKFNVIITIAQLYEFNTIAGLCDLLKKDISSSENKRKAINEIEETINALRARVLKEIPNPENIEDIYPMSDIQKGMVILSTLNPDAGVYHDQFVFQIPTINVALFKQAFTKLIWKHESLRTRFDLSTYGEEIQIVEKDIDFAVGYQDIQQLDTAEQEDFIKAFMVSERGNPFNMESGLLWRITLFDISQTSMIFLFQFHHAILDGWSIASLNTELFKIYHQLESASDIKLEKLKSTHKDSVIEELYEKNNSDTIGFWKDELSDYKRLDIFRNEPEIQGLTKVYDFDFKYKLERRCETDGVSAKTVLYAAFVYVLKVMNYEEDFVIGMVTNNRPIVEDGDKILGCFLNTIPVRNRLGEFHDSTWRDYFKNTEERLRRLKTKEGLTLYAISKVTNEETIEGSPFFDVLYNYVDFHIYNELGAYGNSREQNLTIESFETTNTGFDLNVNLTGNALTLGYKLKRGLKINIPLIKIHQCIDQILSLYIDSPDVKIKDTSLLSYEEREKIVTEFNATEINYEKDKTILDLYKSRVLEYPESISVCYQGITLNYRELDGLTSQLSNYLQVSFGVLPNDLVGLKLERSENMLVSVLGILKCGAAYVPLDTSYPEARLAYIKSDSGYKVCIDELFLETFEKEKDNFKRTVEGVSVTEKNIAYAIYTSGSTGNPKGVLNDHAGLYNRLLWMRDDLGINSEDVILQKTPYTFDVSVWELLMPCITGCKLVFAKPEGHKDPLYLQELIEEQAISIVHFVPSMLGIFLEGLDVSRCKSLKHVVCSGEALPAVLVEEFKEKLPWVRIHNLYGPTEAAIDVSSIELTEVDTNQTGVTIGKPVANTKLYIVDKHMSLQPIGVPGELLIEGVQVARGYLNRPELTAEKFIASPFHSGERVYRTGDLAKWLPNGEIAYLGRIDNQVKIRGNRIELGEIETRIFQSGYVSNSVVVVKGEGSLRKFLVAYVIPKEGYQQEILYAYLKDQLPDYMLPSMVIEMESFPITANGKLNRKALPEAAGDAVGLSSYVAPGNEMEESLATIWKEVLEIDKVGVRDNFFRIGGDSIMAIRLVGKINKKFNVIITIAQLYEFNTIAGLCDLLKKDISSSENKRKAINEIEETINALRARVLKEIPNPENIEDIYPMSDIQKGMVILSTLNSDTGVYHNQVFFQIPTINVALFKQAFTKLIWKHESLRTRFDLSTYGEEIQIVEKDIDFAVGYQDIQQLDTAEQEDFIKAFMVSERGNPFNMESGLLWRITLFDISQTSMIFLFQFHHAILDGWSIASLNTELFKIYHQLESASDIKLEKLKSTHKDSVIEELYEKNNSDTIGFWKDELSDYKRLDIFRNEPEIQGLTKVYDFDFKYKLERRCETDGVSAKTVLYAAFVYVLKVMNYEEDFVIGMVTNNRPIVEDGDKILGCFLNTIPVRNRLGEFHDSTWRDYFKNTEERLRRLKTKEGLTLYAISKVTNEETIEGSPFFDVLYNYVDFHIYNELGAYGNSREQNLTIESFETTNTGFDLNVNLTGNALTLGYKLKRGLKINIPLIKIHQCIDQILSLYIDSPDVKIKDTSLLSYEEREKIVTEFNATEINYEKDKTILDLYKSRVLEYPESISVCYQGITLNYRELDGLTSQLSNYLQVSFGVLPNDLVGLKLERSENMLVSVLGILKCGAAYVPLDTSYPEARLAYIKSDSGYKVCIDELFLETFEKEKDNFKRTVEGVSVTEKNIAYAIYTSGSTGNPKGVLNDHAGLYNRLLWMRDDLGINSEDVILQKTPYTFDVSVWELLMPCITGCKLVFAKPEGHKDPLYLQELIEEQAISIVHFVPSMLGIFLEGLDVSRCKSLKHVVCSGEALPAVLVEEFKEKLPWVRIHNLYGPTEAAIDVSSIELTEVDTNQTGVTIGKPVANTKLYIVDKHMSLQPIGVPGELLIEGVQVARGYLNRPELTAEKFIASPFHSGERVYRTGDLAKWLPNGEIAYLGRIDNQVKIRGNRIELGEIETRIFQSGYVSNSVVVVKGEGSLRKFLVAYVIPKEGYQQEILYAYLKDQLPDYMLPSMVIEMESFPITANGKLNRKALPEAAGDAVGLSSYVAPGNEMEESLATIWKEVLEIDKVGVRDNFFRIGGDSIMAIRLISKINKKFDVIITIAQLYEFNTIAGLVDQIINNTTSFEESRKVRADIKMSFDSLMDEVLGNK